MLENKKEGWKKKSSLYMDETGQWKISNADLVKKHEHLIDQFNKNHADQV